MNYDILTWVQEFGKIVKVTAKVAPEECCDSSSVFRICTQHKRSMEFLPIEKYSFDRKTAKHKKDVAKLRKKAVVKELKDEGKVKTRRTATRAVTAEDETGEQESKRVVQKSKPVKSKSKAVKSKNEPVKGTKKAEKTIPPSEEREKEKIRSALTKNAPKNRLFVNMKKKILDIQEVKDLHPDIISVTMPRKKRSSWCWAVFDSKEKAIKALKVLKKREDIIVNPELSDAKKKVKREKAVKKVKLKKEMKKAIRNTWV